MVDVYFTRADIVLVVALLAAMALLGFWVGSNITVKPTFTKVINLTNTAIYPTTITETRTLVLNRTVTETLPGGVVTTTVTKTTTTTVATIVTYTSTTVIYNATTVTSTTTSTTTLPYTLTVTTTVVENASVLPPLNLTNINETITWMRTAYALGMMTLANLSLPLGYCLATMWVFPNASIAIVGAWIAPVGAIQQALNNSLVAPVLAYTFPRTGVNEYQFYPPQVVWINPQSFMVSTAGFNGAWALSTAGYPWSGYTVVAMASMHPSYVDWAFRYLNNGTYLMIFAWPWQVPEGAIQLLANPPGLCLVQVIRVKPGTPNSYIDNMTFLGAQYWAWVRSIVQYGKPAPCYVPWEWTYGWWVGFINVTKPIGGNWQYYCGPGGKWLPLKP
jgi:hypothetical protein